MKKILTVLSGIIISLFFMNSIAFADMEKVILIDAGHGGIDGGAVSKSGVIEKDINLQISLALKEKLEGAGYKVFMTRDSDIGLYTEGKTIKEKKREDLSNRVKMRKNTDAQVFISIHQNMFPEAKYSGTQVWYSPNSNDSKQFASIIQNFAKDKLRQNTKREAKDAKTQFMVLRNSPNAAAVIVECGFLSNPEECELLGSKEYQEKFSQMIKESVDEYYSYKEKLQS
ncbi:MAG: N-acetylmuramoyl-L-alanine amidase CwlD [Sarcina sp.]